jgi:hypothetical protein
VSEVFVPETLRERFDRVFREQKRTLVVCPDDFRTSPEGVYGYENDMGLVGWRMAIDAFMRLLPEVGEARALAGAPGAGKSTWLRRKAVSGVLYFDATLSRRSSRREIVGAARVASRPIDCVYLDTDLDVCLERNRHRTPDRRVPEEALRRHHHRLTTCPPAVEEGWRAVLRTSSVLGALGGPQRRSREPA